jgi:hypothetical protein
MFIQIKWNIVIFNCVICDLLHLFNVNCSCLLGHTCPTYTSATYLGTAMPYKFICSSHSSLSCHLLEIRLGRFKVSSGKPITPLHTLLSNIFLVLINVLSVIVCYDLSEVSHIQWIYLWTQQLIIYMQLSTKLHIPEASDLNMNRITSLSIKQAQSSRL